MDLAKDVADALALEFPAKTRLSHSAIFANAREIIVDGKVVKSPHDLGEPANDRGAAPAAPLKPIHIDPIERQAAIHRSALAVHEQEILAIERVRDITVRTLEADMDEADRAHRERVEGLLRRIFQENERADRRVATRQRLAKSSRAALMALDPDLDEIVPAKPKRPTRRRK